MAYWGYDSVIGKRPSQQDAVCGAQVVANGCQLFGVFDGHGGHGGERCSSLAATQLHTFVKEQLKNQRVVSVSQAKEALTKSFEKFDQHLRSLPRYSQQIVQPGLLSFLARAYQRMWDLPSTSGEVLADFDHSGSCACVVMTTPSFFLVANLGDSRCILSDGTCVTEDHTSEVTYELQRVYMAGGWVAKGRVCGTLVPTRAFGDLRLKKHSKEAGPSPISNRPQFHVIPRNSTQAKHLILVCDGVTDVISNKGIANLCEMNASLDESQIAAVITRTAYRLGSKDNLSAVVIKTDIPSPWQEDVGLDYEKEFALSPSMLSFSKGIFNAF